jgi:hypothetical protein
VWKSSRKPMYLAWQKYLHSSRRKYRRSSITVVVGSPN